MEQRLEIKFCVNLKNAATETFGMLQNVFEWHKRFKERFRK
jgi:hypothetical protein